VITSPARPSAKTFTPSDNDITLEQPTMAGIPSPRATIAVCDVGPPFSTTSAKANFKFNAAVSAGVKSSATIMVGAVKTRPSLSVPDNFASKRLQISSKSAARSAKYPPIASSASLNPPKAATTSARTSG